MNCHINQQVQYMQKEKKTYCDNFEQSATVPKGRHEAPLSSGMCMSVTSFSYGPKCYIGSTLLREVGNKFLIPSGISGPKQEKVTGSGEARTIQSFAVCKRTLCQILE
jgi:hypothetical protein